MDQSLIINKKTYKSFNLITILNYLAFISFSICMYVGYSNMLNSMNNMLKNTYAMCNMTHVLTSAPATCYL